MDHDLIRRKSCLAPGFRFHPTDEELVRYYLTRKVCGKPFRFQSVSKPMCTNPSHGNLPGPRMVLLQSCRQEVWQRFSVEPCHRARLLESHWEDRAVHHKGQAIGSKKTLAFHVGRAPDGKRTDWVMHEYRLSDKGLERAQVAQGKDAYVLRRIFQKTGLGPPTGDRYAPFLEDEWEDDEALFVPGGEPREDTDNGNGTRNDTVQTGTPTIDFVCKRAKPEDENGLKSEPEAEPLSSLNKRSKQVDPSSSSNAHGSDYSATIHDKKKITNLSSALVKVPLLEPIAAKEAHHLTTAPPSFDASTLEKSLPPRCLKYISDLETVIRNVLTEKESLKLEVMRAEAMINVLHTRVDHLTKENNELKSGG